MSDAATVIPARLNSQGISEARATLTPSSDQRDKVIHCDVRPCIPVIFLPGVMGTNLKTTAGTAVWTPPNASGVSDVIGALFSLLGWLFRDAATRQTRLNPNGTVVDNHGAIEVGSSGLSEDQARERGWGEVHQTSYQGFLAYLQYQLNHPMLNGEPEGDWHEDKDGSRDRDHASPDKPVLMTEPGSFGAKKPGPALSGEMLKHFSHYQYPVYAIGYNWTQSNGRSAEVAFTRIKAICEGYGEGTKAIVVTHSMGGIVARALAKLVPGGEELIHGVLHGAQPATGAPVAAKRFRTGAEDLAGKAFLGSNDAEWTAVAASSQAALELLPMPDYRDGKPWWLICDEKGKPVLSLPREPGQAAREIYGSSAWYGLIPDDSLIDPAGIIKKNAEVVSGKTTVRRIYTDSINTATNFQKQIAKQYHHTTYALYGDGALANPGIPKEDAKDLMTFGTVRWQGALPPGTTEADLMAGKLWHDDHHGNWRVQVRGQIVTLQIQGPDEAGDGTVPAISAAAQLNGSGVQQIFKQGGFEHQFCYNYPWSRWAALYAVAQIAQLIPEPEVCHA